MNKQEKELILRKFRKRLDKLAVKYNRTIPYVIGSNLAYYELKNILDSVHEKTVQNEVTKGYIKKALPNNAFPKYPEKQRFELDKLNEQVKV